MDNKKQLQLLTQQIKSCTRCDLYKSASHSVAGEGNPNAKIVFIGEAPGQREDLLGRPFVGHAGKYLDLLLEKTGLSRQDVFITNMVKHRPPENRDPQPAEIAACNVWLEKQLSAISPKIIVTLGKWSLNYYLPTKKISEIHGQPFKKVNVVLIPMYHPAAALRNGSLARELENDFVKNKELLHHPDTASQISSSLERDGQGSLF